jgi:hypothetical protein
MIALVAATAAVLSFPDGFGERLGFCPSWKDAGPALAIADPGKQGSGSVWIVDGSGSLLTRLAGGPDEAFGRGLAGGRDLDGDGVCDLLVGAARGEPDEPEGLVRMVSGKTGEPAYTIVTPSSRGGNPVWTFGGAHIAAIDDVDGDGLADFCVGLPTAREGAGIVRICRGTDGATLNEIVGEGVDGLGRVVVGLGDVDGDRIGDLAVGTVQANCVRIYALPGMRHLRDLRSPEPKRGGFFGGSMAACDGLLLIGQAGQQDGAAFLVSTSDWRTTRSFAHGPRYGASVAFLHRREGSEGRRILVTQLGKGFEAGLVEVFEPDQEAPSISVWDRSLTSGFGMSVVGVGDADGDGEPDFAVGAAWGYPRTSVGFYSGRTAELIRTIRRKDLEPRAKPDGR